MGEDELVGGEILVTNVDGSTYKLSAITDDDIGPLEIKETKMNERELKYWALIKWRAIVRNNGIVPKYPPNKRYIDLTRRQFKSNCSYCEQYNNDLTSLCKGCPLNMGLTVTQEGEAVCSLTSHIFSRWWSVAGYTTKEPTVESKDLSKEMLQLIYNVKVDRKELFFRSK